MSVSRGHRHVAEPAPSPSLRARLGDHTGPPRLKLARSRHDGASVLLHQPLVVAHDFHRKYPKLARLFAR